MTEQLEALAVRCEQAAGPSQELDTAIYTVVRKGVGCTRSVDAALSLVPEGHHRRRIEADVRYGAVCYLYEGENANASGRGSATTEALAITAAALRARAA